MDWNGKRESKCGEQTHLQWIDAAKGVAIIAVIIDHSTGILFSNKIISLCSFFSVTVFVFLGGITSYLSSERHNQESIKDELRRKVKSILIPYIVATCIYQLIIENRLELMTLLRHLMEFDITSPFYFVVFYIQLLIISPYLYRLINRWEGIYGKLMHCLMLALAVIISLFCIKRTFVLDVWGGGKYILGGSYFIVFFLGELSTHYGWPLRKKKSRFKMLISISVVCMCIAWLAKYEFDLDLWLGEPFGQGLNPPGITLMIYGGGIVVALYYLFSYVEVCNSEILKWLYMLLAYIGHYSLYIFLYHRLVLDYFLIHMDISNIWLKRATYIICMLGIPIVLKVAANKMNSILIRNESIKNE